MKNIENNYAYIDSQNLYMTTKSEKKPWQIDMKRFRVYLREKYNVSKAFLFIGAYDFTCQDMYCLFQDFGYILVFRPHGKKLKGKKKGNIDTDLVFYTLVDVFTNDDLDKVVIISGDGDYYRMVQYLKSIDKLKCILVPSKKSASSLYYQYGDKYLKDLSSKGIKEKIKRRK